MALEVEPKQLHKHALPLAVALLVISVVSLASTIVISSNAGKALVTQVMHVQSGSNGVAHVSFNEPTETLGGTGVQAGQAAQRSLILESAARDAE